MKKTNYKLILMAFLAISFLFSSAQTFEIRTLENDYGYLTVQMRETSGIGTPTTATNIVDITFVVRYPSGTQDLSLLCSTNDYSIIDGLAGEKTFEGYDYHYWNGNIASPIHPPHDWTQNEWEDIAVFYVSGATGSGLFEIAPNFWHGRSLNWNQELVDFTPTINGDVTYSFPTIVYNYVWEGGNLSPPFYDGNSWGNAANWRSECGGTQAAAPTSASNCYIPSGKTHYPQNVFAFNGIAGTALANNVRIQSDATINFLNVNADNFAISGDLLVDGTLTINPTSSVNPGISVAGTVTLNATNSFVIKPNASTTFNGATNQNAANSMVIQASATGVGSFIDNGTIAYGGSGSAKVQTYLANTASPPDFHFHLVGPTVDITGTGVQLSAFNVANGNTYAYRYNEPTDTWLNYYNLSDPVPTAKGIGLSTNDGLAYTMEMTGKLKTGNITSEAMTRNLNGNYLLSNPYPSSIFWNDLYSNNNVVVSDKVYIYDATFSGGNYRAYNQGSGGTDDFTGYIQVGQGFFVEAISASPFSFDNGDRYHSNAPFYKSGTFTNRLDVRVTGNESRDGLLVHFYEGAVSGYEPNEDVSKRMSYSPTATQFWSVLENNQKLSINALPLELLGGGMHSVPVSFICSAATEYTMSFFDIESFDPGIEIWLEDKHTEDDWLSLNIQAEYTFTGSPDDAADRFVLHFFGSTGTDEITDPIIEIYSFGQYVYLRNNTTETIKEIRIYSLTGALVNKLNSIHDKFLKLWVDDQTAFYVITVITDQEVYTKKIFISK